MTIHYKVLLKVVGILVMVTGLSMLPSFFVSIIYGDPTEIIQSLFFSSVLPIVFGYTVFYAFKGYKQSLKLRDGFILLALCWLIASLVGSVPFIVSGAAANPVNAFFESVSGFSTTGASVFNDVESLPRGIIFWRATTQWVGGIGILVLAVGLMPSLGISGQNVLSNELPNLSLGKISTKMPDVIKTLYITYITFTIAEIIALKLAGLSVYDAVVHTFATVGTGGFTAYNDGISHFNSTGVYLIIMVFMLLCGINFNLYFSAIRRGIPHLVNDVEFRFYILAIAIASVLICGALLISGYSLNISKIAVESLFHTISIISTTGFTSADYMTWPIFCQAILLMLMFIGGCSSSTSGGVKAVRILVIIRYINHGIRSRLHPNSVEPITINGNSVPSNTVSGVTYHVFLYILMLFAGTFIISIDNMGLETSFSAVISCMGNIGPALGSIGATCSYGDFSWLSKLALCGSMLAGRLELYTLFILFTPRFWRPDNS